MVCILGWVDMNKTNKHDVITALVQKDCKLHAYTLQSLWVVYSCENLCDVCEPSLRTSCAKHPHGGCVHMLEIMKLYVLLCYYQYVNSSWAVCEALHKQLVIHPENLLAKSTHLSPVTVYEFCDYVLAMSSWTSREGSWLFCNLFLTSTMYMYPVQKWWKNFCSHNNPQRKSNTFFHIMLYWSTCAST